MGIPDHFICLLRNLYAGQEATGRTGRGTTDWFKIGKGVWQSYILSPCLYNLYAEWSEVKWSEVKWSEVKSLSRVRLFATPWGVAHQAPPSVGFSRQECWSGLPFPSPGDLLNPGIEPGSPALRADALPSEPPPPVCSYYYQSSCGILIHSAYFKVHNLQVCLSHCLPHTSLKPNKSLIVCIYKTPQCDTY